MRTFTVGKNDCGRRLDQYLKKLMPAITNGQLYQSLRKKRVKINGKRVTDGSERLCEGDCLELYFNDEYFEEKPLPFWTKTTPHLSIIYEDAHIIIMDKPPGLPSQSDGETPSLESHMRAHLYQSGAYRPETEAAFVPSLCHRIDRNTAGLVIGAKDAESLRIMNQKIRDREVEKFYLCLTEGTPQPPNGEIRGYLHKDETMRKMIFSERPVPGSCACHTVYRVLRPGAQALVEAKLLTGRTHQLRAGFAHLGHPLIGDVKYGAKKDGKRQFQHLLAYRLVFRFSTDSGCLSYLNQKEFVSDRSLLGIK